MLYLKFRFFTDDHATLYYMTTLSYVICDCSREQVIYDCSHHCHSRDDLLPKDS
jgi:hypothetical protein